MIRTIWLALCLILAVAAAGPAQGLAQGATVGSWDAFLLRGQAEGDDQLIFQNVLTGESNRLTVDGSRYTALRDGVLFFSNIDNTVQLARPDGTIGPHPFVRITPDARRIDWVVAEDGFTLAWTLTYAEGDNLRTETYILGTDGATPRLVLEDGPQVGLRALPVAFSPDAEHLYMDAYPDGLERFVAYDQYAGLFALNIENGAVTPLPGEPACFCGGAIRANQFVRLSLTADLRGFDVRVQPINGEAAAGTVRTVPAIPLNNFTQAGDVLIAPDGTLAVYALSDVANFGTPQQTIRTVFMLVDLLQYTQRPLTEPITTYVHPVQWTEDNSAILFTSPQRDGTWKINLNSGQLQKVADATYLGSVGN